MWTDGRLKERFDGIDNRFEAIDDRFDAIDSRFDGIDRTLDRVDRDIRELRTLMLQLWGSTIVGSIGVIATLLATR
jgi:archaellum component FlaC